MIDTNILVTTIGSHSCNTVIKSLRSFFPNKIYGCDIYPSEWASASLMFDDTFVAPYASEETKYLDFLISLCSKYKIGLILPLLDFEVDFFNKYRDVFIEKNIIIAINSSEFITVARNKELVAKIELFSPSYKVVPTYSIRDIDENTRFPLLAKLKNGRGSKGQYIAKSINDIVRNTETDCYVFQEFIEGPIVAVDYIRSSNTRTSFSVARKELRRTPNGAGMTVEVIKDPALDLIVDELGKCFNINGVINLEFILSGNNYYLIDINPRFSTGIGFSNLTGYDFVRNHVLAYTEDYIQNPINHTSYIADKAMVETITKIIEK